MRSPCAPSTFQRCFSFAGLIAHPRTAAVAPRAGGRKHQRCRANVAASPDAAASDEKNETTSSTSSASQPSSSWTATDGVRSEDFLQALGTRQQYNINVDHGE